MTSQSIFSILSCRSLFRGLGTTIGTDVLRKTTPGVFFDSYSVSKRSVIGFLGSGRCSHFPRSVQRTTERTCRAFLRADSKRLTSVVMSETTLSTVGGTKRQSGRRVIQRCTRSAMTMTSVQVTIHTYGAKGDSSFVGGTVTRYSALSGRELVRTTMDKVSRVVNCLTRAGCKSKTLTLTRSTSTFRE